MKVTVKKPRNSQLVNKIQHYFFLKNEDLTYSKKHVCYPNTNHCLGLVRGGRLRKTGDYSYLMEPSAGYSSYLTGLYTKPIEIQYSGPFDEICIDFEPLGIEYLTGTPFSPSEFMEEPVCELFGKDSRSFYERVFDKKDTGSRVVQIEKEMLRILRKNETFLRLNQFNDIDEAAKQMGISYRSLHRRFAKELSIGPKQFFRMNRFRKAISLIDAGFGLADTTYRSGFSDQSHMTREFRRFSNRTPVQFKKTSTWVESTICWSRV